MKHYLDKEDETFIEIITWRSNPQYYDANKQKASATLSKKKY
jgi:hypothetical protein